MSPADERRARFLRRVEDAAAQYWMMRRWDDDAVEEEEGWGRCYAVDADVVKMYGSPALNARRRGNRWGYSEVFRDDPQQCAVALGRRVADYLFYDLQKNGAPLLIVPPIDREVISIVNALAVKLGDNPPEPSVDFDALMQWEQKARSTLPEGKSEDAKTLLDELAPIFSAGITETMDEFLKIAQLLGKRRIVPAHSIEARDGFHPAVREALSAPLALKDMYDIAKRGAVWRELLKTMDNPSRGLRLAADAEALARLELWNAKLEPARWRIVYITGARHVFEAVEGRHQFDGESRTEVRHPRHFLASPKVVSLESAGQLDGGRHRSQFLDLVRTFLADCRVEPNGDMHLSEASRAAATTAYSRNPEIAVEFETTWNAYMHVLKVDRPEYSRFADRFREKAALRIGARQTLESALSFREDALSSLEDMLDEAWEQCFRAAVKAGFFIGRTSRVRLEGAIRLVPPIVFERWPSTQEFVQLMSRNDGPATVGAAYEEWLEKIKAETGAAAYAYALYLAHAALFAGRGDWKVGAIVARRAWLKATSVHTADAGNLAHGREAAYLAAYCLRHAYKSLAELDEAKQLLERAVSTYEAERESTPDLEVQPERFDVERLAQEMTSLLHRWFLDREDESPEAVLDLRKRMVAFFSTLEKTKKNLPLDLKERLLVRLASNIVVLSALTKSYDTYFDAAGACLERAPKGSEYIRAIALFYRAIRDPRVSTHEVGETLGEKELRVLPYDDARFSFLFNQLLQLRERR